MGFFDGLVARDKKLAGGKYKGRESATARSARLRREQHHARVARDGDKSGRPFRFFR
ncbi:hypothetical protein [Streptomyces sp. NPDC005989]|uniref:hypothetical protein n=1 Tax=Streptomyces sp. NPDC005989 TaxID=3156727 RepID=UPI0033E21270